MLKLYNIRDLGNSHHTPLLTDAEFNLQMQQNSD